jgi:hypothetical protein
MDIMHACEIYLSNGQEKEKDRKTQAKTCCIQIP